MTSQFKMMPLLCKDFGFQPLVSLREKKKRGNFHLQQNFFIIYPWLQQFISINCQDLLLSWGLFEVNDKLTNDSSSDAHLGAGFRQTNMPPRCCDMGFVTSRFTDQNIDGSPSNVVRCLKIILIWRV